jgi:hypothetical protein
MKVANEKSWMTCSQVMTHIIPLVLGLAIFCCLFASFSWMFIYFFLLYALKFCSKKLYALNCLGCPNSNLWIEEMHLLTTLNFEKIANVRLNPEPNYPWSREPPHYLADCSQFSYQSASSPTYMWICRLMDHKGQWESNLQRNMLKLKRCCFHVKFDKSVISLKLIYFDLPQQRHQSQCQKPMLW